MKGTDPMAEIDAAAHRLLTERGLLVEALLDLVRQITMADLDTEEERIIYPGLALATDTARAVLGEVLGGAIGG